MCSLLHVSYSKMVMNMQKAQLDEKMLVRCFGQ